MFPSRSVALKGILSASLACAVSAAAEPAHAKGLKTLYSFCSQDCGDGAAPSANLMLDNQGNLFGTATYGGAGTVGTAFELSPEGTETTLYTFQGMPDGANPYSSLIADKKGNLFGTTLSGGKAGCDVSSGCGTVFKLTPKGTETVLYAFCSKANCTDGATPVGGLVADGDGNFYGTTSSGGKEDGGVLFKVSSAGVESALYKFCSQMYCTDGNDPLAGLIIDKQGNLYGTTSVGGAGNAGVVFKVTPKGKETVLYSFQGASDGGHPLASLFADSSGNLYGSTSEGGTGCSESNGCGTIFKITPTGAESVIYSFCVSANCADGAFPESGVIADDEGNFYGTTEQGGSQGAGVAYKITSKGKESVLHSFTGGKDGGTPSAGLISDGGKALYGVANSGGLYEGGAVFQITN